MSREYAEAKEESLLSPIIFRYLPYWPLFIGLLIIGVATAFGYIQYTAPIYESSTTILLKDNKKGVTDLGMEEALNIFSSNKIVENEIEQLRSIKLMTEIVNELNLYAPVFEKQKFKYTSAYNSSPVAVLAKNPEKLTPTDYINFSVRAGKEVIINNRAYPLNQWVTTPYGELQFVANSKQTKEPMYPLVFQLTRDRNMAAIVASSLNVKATSKLSTVVSVSLRDEVPQRSEDILNKLAEVYNRFSLEDKNRIGLNTLSFIESRLQAVERELDSLEGSIQNYRSKKGVVNLGEQSRLFLQTVGDNDRRLSDLNMKLAMLSEVEKYVSSKDASAGIVPSTVGVEDPALSQLVQRLYSAELEYEKLRKTTGEKNPLVIPLAKEIEQIRPQIFESIKNQRNSLLASKSNLSATSGSYNSMLSTIPQKERELADISRQQTIKNSVYSFLLQKREQTALAVSSSIADSKVIDLAVSTVKPVSPKIPFIYLGSIIGSLLFGIGIISAKEVLNRKILFRSEIEALTGLPVIAEISNAKKKESLLHTGSKFSLVAEQFRHLRAAIGLYGRNTNHKRLMVTSSIPGEGKSYISTNLAVSIALSGKKVALIDLDIRNPKVSSVMGVANEAGVVEFLIGEKEPHEIIRPTKFANLFVISAGREEENAMELILSGKLKELLTSLQDEFEYLVIDTSPIDPVTDASVLSDYCDRTLFVVRHGYTPKAMVQHFDVNKKMETLKNPVIVFNDVRSRGFIKGTYGYGYGYGYANVYRDRSKQRSAKKV